MKKFLKSMVNIFIAVIVIGNTYLVAQNYIAITNLLSSQSIVIGLQGYFNEINVQRNKLLEEKIIKKSIESVNKPTFEYLQSMTVRVLLFKNKEAIISGKVGTGTGVIVKVTEDYTYILTNKHVAPIDSIKILVEKNGKRYNATVLKNSLFRDLSLIRIVGKIPNTNTVKGYKKIKEQSKIFSVGMYMGLSNIYTEGTVAGWWKESRLMNMPCLNGCSGSGVFDENGYLVAIVYAGAKYNMFGFDTAKAICVPYIGIITFLEEIL